MINIIDGFLPIGMYEKLKEYSLKTDYQGERNPYDGIIYPNITMSIPDEITSAILGRLEELLKRKPEKVTIFLRASPAGCHVPHIAHHDLLMGHYSMMLYLNDHSDGGTALLRHKETGIGYAPESKAFCHIVAADQNNVNGWSILQKSEMKQNRAAIFDAGYFHCALPVGGFGSTAEDQRVVLTVFFS